MAADDEEREEVLTLVSFRAALLVDNGGLGRGFQRRTSENMCFVDSVVPCF